MWSKISWYCLVLCGLSLGFQAKLKPLSFHLLKSPQILSGDTLQVVVEIPQGWHLTSNAPKSEFQVPMESHAIGNRLTFAPTIYPPAKITPMPALGFDGSWFVDSLVLKFPVAQVQSPTWSDVQIKLDFQACTDVFCIPPRTDSANFKAQEICATTAQPRAAKSFEILSTIAKTNQSPHQGLTSTIHSTSRVWHFLFWAFLGGLILNLMPCVLPVLGIKVFGLIQKRDRSPKDLALHALSFTLGTLCSFWLLSLVMILLKQGGRAMGWGFQFQEPGFVLFMALIVALFALNLLGMFEISLSWKAQTKLDQAAKKGGWLGAFFSGAFMTLLATPCTAPMLSPAMAFAFSQSNGVLFAFMSAVAMGLALPYSLVCIMPGSRRFFPKPGDWMIKLKEGMGFLLLLTLVWLLYTFGQMCGNYALSLLIAWIVLLALALWIWKALPWCSPFAEKTWPKILSALVLALLLMALLQNQVLTAMHTFAQEQTLAKVEAHKYQNKKLEDLSPSELYKKPFDLELIKKLNQKGLDVFVDFTADWCISCHANEKIALAPHEVDQWFRQGKPILLIGDYTHQDPAISSELQKFGRSGVPMYVLYKANGQSLVLPEVISSSLVLDAIHKGP